MKKPGKTRLALYWTRLALYWESSAFVPLLHFVTFRYISLHFVTFLNIYFFLLQFKTEPANNSADC